MIARKSNIYCSIHKILPALFRQQIIIKVLLLYFLCYCFYLFCKMYCHIVCVRACVCVCSDKGLEWRGTGWIPEYGWLCSSGDAAFGSGQRVFVGGPEESSHGPIQWCTHLCQRVPCFYWSGQVHVYVQVARKNSDKQRGILKLNGLKI